MLQFERSMDPRSMDVYRELIAGKRKRLGMIQWHDGRDPRFVSELGVMDGINLSELGELVSKLVECLGEEHRQSVPLSSMSCRS